MVAWPGWKSAACPDTRSRAHPDYDDRMKFVMAPIAAILVLAVPASAQRPADIVRWSARPPAADVRPGSTANVELTASIQSGWHLYALTQPLDGPRPLAVVVPATAPFVVKAGGISGPKPSVSADPNFSVDTRYYADKVTLQVPVTPKADLKPGTHALPIEITFQACSNEICLRPYTEKLSVDVTVAPAATRKR